jgi:hypothetical protein
MIDRRVSRADVKQLQVLYNRIIFGTNGAPKWMKKHILQLDGCELADYSGRICYDATGSIERGRRIFEEAGCWD